MWNMSAKSIHGNLFSILYCSCPLRVRSIASVISDSESDSHSICQSSYRSANGLSPDQKVVRTKNRKKPARLFGLLGQKAAKGWVGLRSYPCIEQSKELFRWNLIFYFPFRFGAVETPSSTTGLSFRITPVSQDVTWSGDQSTSKPHRHLVEKWFFQRGSSGHILTLGA
jgi:hypothetical protein